MLVAVTARPELAAAERRQWWDYRRVHPDPDSPCQPDGMGGGRDGAGKTGRAGDDGSSGHGGAELAEAAHRSWGGPVPSAEMLAILWPRGAAHTQGV
jgi:hypothetical protein